jgi:hypothetical protein
MLIARLFDNQERSLMDGYNPDGQLRISFEGFEDYVLGPTDEDEWREIHKIASFSWQGLDFQRCRVLGSTQGYTRAQLGLVDHPLPVPGEILVLQREGDRIWVAPVIKSITNC